MELKKLFTEDRAVSPVIAVVLMIAVTVILAAVVAAFALGLGGSADQTPQASFDYDYSENDPAVADDDELVITHEGGDSLSEAQVDVLVNGAVEGSGSSWSSDPINAGSTFTISDGGAGTGTSYVSAGDEVRLRWTGEDGQTATLSTYDVPT